MTDTRKFLCVHAPVTDYVSAHRVTPRHVHIAFKGTDVVLTDEAFAFGADVVRKSLASSGSPEEVRALIRDLLNHHLRTAEDEAAVPGPETLPAFCHPTPKAEPRRLFAALSPQAKLVFQHMRRAGSISAREAMADHGITSASLARRICDIEAEGFGVNRERRKHPITGKEFTRYSLTDD